MNSESRSGAITLRVATTLALVAPITFGATAAAFAAEETPDTTAPDTTFNVGTTPASGWFRGPAPVRLVATDAESGVDALFYSVNGAAAVRSETHDVSISLTADGVNTVTAWAVDVAGNVEEQATYTARIDTVVPEISVATPTSIIQGSAVTIDYACTDVTSGVAECNGNLADGASIDTSIPGDYTVTISAVDVAGNVTTSDFDYTVVEDLEGPAVTFQLPPVPVSGWYTGPVDLGIAATDVATIQSLNWRAQGPVDTDGVAFFESSDTVRVDWDGVTTFTAWAVDSHGNRSADQTQVVRIDTQRPTIRIITPDVLPSLAADQFTQGQNVPFDFECTDATSGVQDCWADGANATTLRTDTIGNHRVRISAIDEAGNTAFYEFAYEVVAAPVVVDPAPGNGSGNGSGAPRPGVDTLAHTGTDADLLTTGGAVVAILLAGGLGLMLASRKPARR